MVISGGRALIFAPSFAPDFFSEALVNAKFALALLRAGWDVEVFSAVGDAQSSYSRGFLAPWADLEPVTRRVAPPRGKSWREKVEDALVCRYPISGGRWAVRAAASALSEHCKNPYDLIISRSTSCVAHLPALIFRRSAAVPWVANWNDPAPWWFPPPYSPVVSRFSRIVGTGYLRAAARHADLNTFPSERLRSFLSQRLDIKSGSNSLVVPHVGLGEVVCRPREKVRRFTFCHAGNLSVERDPVRFLAALASLQRSLPNVDFRLIIAGSCDSHVMGHVRALGLEGMVEFQGGMEYMQCRELMAHCDALVLIEAELEEGIFLPSKLIDYCEVGVPVFCVSPRQGVVFDLLQDFPFGLASDAASGEDILRRLGEFVLRVRGGDDFSIGRNAFIGYCSGGRAIRRILGSLRAN